MPKYEIVQTSTKILDKFIVDGTAKDTGKVDSAKNTIYKLPALEVELIVWPLAEVDKAADTKVKAWYKYVVDSVKDIDDMREIVKSYISRVKTLACNNNLAMYTREGLDPHTKALIEKAKAISKRDADFNKALTAFMDSYGK